MKQLAWYTAVSLTILAVAYLLWVFSTAIVLFILSLMLAAILRPMVDRLEMLRLPRGLALAITYLAVVATAAALGLFLGGSVITELQAMVVDLPRSYEQIKTNWLIGSWLQRIIAQNFPDLSNLFQTVTGGEWNAFMQSLLGMTLGSLGLFSKITIIFVLSIYWSADQDRIKRLWLSLLPSEWRVRSRETWQNMESEIGSYLRSELIQSLLTVIILGIGYQLIGLKYPVLLAVIAAVGWLIVWFGGLVAVLPALLVGLSTSPVIGLSAALLTIAVLSILEFIVEPKLFDRHRLSSFLVVIMVLIMVKQYGIIGFLAAPPSAAAIQIFAGQLVRLTTIAPAQVEPLPAGKMDILRERLGSVQTMITERSEPPPREIINLIDRLDELIDRANQEEQLTD